MHIAYSALRPMTTRQTITEKTELHLRYQAYIAACRTHSHYIAEIQKYLPGWTPRFR